MHSLSPSLDSIFFIFFYFFNFFFHFFLYTSVFQIHSLAIHFWRMPQDITLSLYCTNLVSTSDEKHFHWTIMLQLYWLASEIQMFAHLFLLQAEICFSTQYDMNNEPQYISIYMKHNVQHDDTGLINFI